MQEVTKTGTAGSARAKLGRSDIAGKTGTTNDSHDAWFAGYVEPSSSSAGLTDLSSRQVWAIVRLAAVLLCQCGFLYEYCAEG